MNINQEFRNARLVQAVVDKIRQTATRPWVIMEICGGQTHAFMQTGLDQLLPASIELVHGPGCPVCVTSLELIDKALAIAMRPDVIFTSFGDMLRVPGSRDDLFSIRARGGDIRVVYSPLDSVRIARENPEKQVVFFAIGFETTAPANAAALLQAKALGLKNYSQLVSIVRVPPAMHAILGSPGNRVQGFLAAGHVCSVMGTREYPPIAARYHVPIVVTGFEPLDLAQGLLMCVQQLEAGLAEVQNAYTRVVQEEGNPAALKMLARVYREVDRNWRGIGTIPLSGWGLTPEFAGFDAENRFDLKEIQTRESEICIAGQILRGLKKPHQCPAFGNPCSPENPLGAPMVSSEGACAAHYRYGREIEKK